MPRPRRKCLDRPEFQIPTLAPAGAMARPCVIPAEIHAPHPAHGYISSTCPGSSRRASRAPHARILRIMHIMLFPNTSRSSPRQLLARCSEPLPRITPQPGRPVPGAGRIVVRRRLHPRQFLPAVCRGHLEAAGAETRDPAYRQLLAKPVASEQVAAGPPTHTDNLKPRPSIPSTEGLDVIVGAYIRDRSPVVLSRVQTRTWFDPRCHLCGTDSVAQQSSSTAAILRPRVRKLGARTPKNWNRAR